MQPQPFRGIEVRGRSTRLTVSYRTTQEILTWAVRMLAGHLALGLDDLEDTLAGYHSPIHGRRPVMRGHRDWAAELDGVRVQVWEWVDAGVEPHAIEVAAHTGAKVRDLRAALDSTPDVRVDTLHSMKGMEFRCVLVAGVDAATVPSPAALASREDDPVAHEQDLQRTVPAVRGVHQSTRHYARVLLRLPEPVPHLT